MFKKLMCSFLTAIFAIAALIVVAITWYTDSILSKDMLEAFLISAESISSQCDSRIIQLQDSLLALATDANIQNALQEFTPGASLHGDIMKTSGSTGFQLRMFPIYESDIYAPNADDIYERAPWLAQESWVSQVVERRGRLALNAVRERTTTSIRISILVTDMRDWTSPLAIIAADMPIDAFVLHIGKSSLGVSDYMVLLDEEGEVQYPYEPSRAISAERIREAAAQGHCTFEDYIFISSPIVRSSWNLILAYSTQSLHGRAATLYRTVAGIVTLAALLSIAFAFAFSYRHSQPIANLARHIKQEDYLQPIEVPRYLNRDYLALYTNYNAMAEQVSGLLEELYETNKRERETQLKMLQSQLNPHFIYNVLDSISWLARRHGAKDIEMIVVSLATMLRCSLNSGRDILSVEQEIRHVQSYLSIQSYRYDNSIDVSYSFEADILDKKMIKLLLQPLVENAIVHGLETHDGKKQLQISGRLENGMLVFEVSNNGNVPDFGRIEQILAGEQHITASYGIRNINERIKAAYGPAYGLRYYQRGEWIVANITVPPEPA